ncbi:hypothetical protein [Streptacidiphilus jiangxiensis]|uniref:Uncharacterized protein n=1 Tax=Streptacidiphilus jiangxiensis TaxID=235985 RepID=A0A1H7M6Y6_STRJI|nr:hypothetical protein [Streptacidiphilus jiangxiensis]SEL06953.1 hypothetical protein SAMN05414137_105214 [Streptacidiphilus jiangxiensis]
MLDISAHPFIAIYVLLLLISGVGLVVLSAMGSGGQTVGWRIFGVIAGLAFFGYGIYLGFFFTGGTYIISFKAVILPFVMLAGVIGKLRAGKAPDAAAPQVYVAPQGVQQHAYNVAAPYASLPQMPPPPVGYQQEPPAGYQPVQPQDAARPYDAAPPPPMAPPQG